MKTTVSFSIEGKLMEKLRKKIGRGNMSEKIEELLKKELGVD